jgi:hypothetical protein
VTEVNLESVKIGSGQHAAERNVESAFDDAASDTGSLWPSLGAGRFPRSPALRALRYCTYICTAPASFKIKAPLTKRDLTKATSSASFVQSSA